MKKPVISADFIAREGKNILVVFNPAIVVLPVVPLAISDLGSGPRLG